MEKNIQNSNRKERITIRLTPYQMQCLRELSSSLNTSYSLMVRSIIQDFITRNEDALERITNEKTVRNATDSEITEEEIFQF